MLAGKQIEAERAACARGNSARCACSRSRSSGEPPADRALAAWRAATGGAMLFENRYGRERWRSQPTISAARGHVAAARAAERLAERAGQDVDAVHDAAQLVRAAAARADEAGGVRVVDHHQGAVAVGQIADLREPGDRAVHGEHAVGRDQAHARVLRVLQRLLELVHVVVGVAQAPRLAQADAVDDAGVIQRVADDRVLLVEQRLEQAAVGVEARRVQDRVLRPEVGAQALLELAVHALRAADEAHRGDAVAVAVERLDGRPRAPPGGSRGPGSCWRTD